MKSWLNYFPNINPKIFFLLYELLYKRVYTHFFDIFSTKDKNLISYLKCNRKKNCSNKEVFIWNFLISLIRKCIYLYEEYTRDLIYAGIMSFQLLTVLFFPLYLLIFLYSMNLLFKLKIYWIYMKIHLNILIEIGFGNNVF